MKILIIVPITGLSNLEIDARLDFLKSIANPNTHIDAVKAERGPVAVESRVDKVLASMEILRLVKKAEEDDYDAAIIWCAEDPALDAAREMVDIPVVGPRQASILLASMLGKKVSVIPPPFPVLDLRKNLDKTIETLKEIIKTSMEKEGADAFVLGCLGLFGLGKTLRNELNVPVVDPAEAALKMAEVMVQLNLRHSRITYPKYPPSHRRSDLDLRI